MDKAKLGSVGVLIVAACAAACGSGSAGKAAAVPASPTASAGKGCSFASRATPLGASGASGTIVLAKIDGRRVGFVADEDARAILTVDLETRTLLAETPLVGAPGQVYVTADGRVIATVRDKNVLVALEAVRADAPLVAHCAVPTPAEPIGIAASAGDATLLVSSGWARKVTAFDGTTLAQRFEVAVGREPRSIVVSDDGKHAFVSHAVGSVMSDVDLLAAKHPVKELTLRGWTPGDLGEAKAQRAAVENLTDGEDRAELVKAFEASQKDREKDRKPSCQGFALAKSTSVPGRIFAPQVMVDPGDLDQRPDGYGDGDNDETETPSVAVVDEAARAPLEPSLVVTRDPTAGRRRGGSARDEVPQCLLPRAAVVDAKTKSLLVTCFGIDAVVSYDASAIRPLEAERRRWVVGAGPSGIAIDPDKHRAVVWSQFDRTVSTFPIGGTELADEKAVPQLVQKTALGSLRGKISSEYALGRILFHAAGDARIAGDGRACASCHPDGRDDAITWATPEGPRRSIMLAGRVSRTPPYSWNGNENTLHAHLGNTFDRLSGRGLRSIELDALVTYVTNMATPPTETFDKAKVQRGKEIFASSEAACSSCHSGPDFTDGRNHDVGSKHHADKGRAFNTPSLHLVGGTGPYFHDGRYGSLSELLDKTDGKMGKTSHLSRDDRDALETFLRTL